MPHRQPRRPRRLPPGRAAGEGPADPGPPRPPTRPAGGRAGPGALRDDLTDPSRQASSEALHHALDSADQLAAVFNDVRPALAALRRQLYQATDEAGYGDPQRTRDAIARARASAATARHELGTLIRGLPEHPTGALSDDPNTPRPHPTATARGATLMEVRAETANVTQLLTAADHQNGHSREHTRDLLIQARLHTAAADNQLCILQIQLERDARSWRTQPAGRDDR